MKGPLPAFVLTRGRPLALHVLKSALTCSRTVGGSLGPSTKGLLSRHLRSRPAGGWEPSPGARGPRARTTHRTMPASSRNPHSIGVCCMRTWPWPQLRVPGISPTAPPHGRLLHTARKRKTPRHPCLHSTFPPPSAGTLSRRCIRRTSAQPASPGRTDGPTPPVGNVRAAELKLM